MRGCSCRGTAGFAHVSCLAEQAKILVVAEAEENNLDIKAFEARWKRWDTCSLCEQRSPRRRGVRARVGVLEDVRGGGRRRTGLGKLYMAMSVLGNGLSEANTTRTRCPCERPSCLRSGALAHQKTTFSP